MSALSIDSANVLSDTSPPTAEGRDAGTFVLDLIGALGPLYLASHPPAGSVKVTETGTKPVVKSPRKPGAKVQGSIGMMPAVAGIIAALIAYIAGAGLMLAVGLAVVAALAVYFLVG